MKNLINEALSIILTFFVYILGGIDVALISLITVMIIDYISGLISAIINKQVDSEIGLNGIFKKFSYLCIIALSVVIDKMTNQNGVIRTLVIYFFVANDGISILENMGEIGIPIPEKLRECLKQLRKE